MFASSLLKSLVVVLPILAIVATPCFAEDKKDEAAKKTVAKKPVEKKAEESKPKKVEKKTDKPAEKPCVTAPCVTDPSRTPRRADGKKPVDGKHTTDKSGKSPAIKRERLLWANSFLWAKAPELVVEKWLGEKPDTEGKYVLIEYWATWCPPCRRSIPLLNEFHKKYGKELVVIGISEESEADVLKMTEPKIDFHLAVDTKKRMKDKLGVFGIPHVIILEPGGYVIWEGFPLQENYELTDKIIERILAVGRKIKAKEEAEKARKQSVSIP